MATLKQDRTVMKRHFRDMLVLGVPFGLTILLTLLLVNHIRESGSPWLMVGMAIAVPIGIVGLIRQERRHRHFRCPTCSMMLHRDPARAKGGDPITFLCERCDTEWDTGFRVSSD